MITPMKPDGCPAVEGSRGKGFKDCDPFRIPDFIDTRDRIRGARVMTLLTLSTEEGRPDAPGNLSGHCETRGALALTLGADRPGGPTQYRTPACFLPFPPACISLG